MTQSSPPVTPERPQDLDALISGRRSVRALLPEPVPTEVIHAAIAAAGWAPSPHGRQPWRFAVIESMAKKVSLADAMAETWGEQLQLDQQADAVVQLRLEKSRQRITTAPVILIACLYMNDLDVYPDPERAGAERIMAIQSLGAAVQNLLLSIYAAGYDAGWMCAPLFCPDILREQLALPSDHIPHAMIPIGRAAADPVRRPRLAPESLISTWI